MLIPVADDYGMNQPGQRRPDGIIWEIVIHVSLAVNKKHVTLQIPGQFIAAKARITPRVHVHLSVSFISDLYYKCTG